MRWLVPLVMALSLIAGGCEQPVQEAVDVSAELDSLETKIVWTKHRLAQFDWQAMTGQPADSQRFYRRLWRDVCGDVSTLERLQRNSADVAEGNDRRRYQLITSLLLKGSVESSPNVVRLRDSLLEAVRTRRVDHLGQSYAIGDIRDSLRAIENSVARERAWQQWAGAGSEIAPGIERLIRMRNQQAVRLRYNNFAALSLDADSIESSWLVALLDSLERITDEPYSRAIERRAQSVGRNQIQPWDLVGIIGSQRSNVDNYFPVDSQIALLKSALQSCGINIAKLPVYWDVSAFEDQPGIVQTCIVRPGIDQRIRANLRPGFGTQTRLAHQVGVAIQSAFVSQEVPLFGYVLDTVWRQTAGIIFQNLVDQPEFLVNVAGVPPGVARAYWQARFDQQVIEWRIMLAEARFEYEAYVNANRDLDDLWWGIAEEVLRVPRHDQLSPWASGTEFISHPFASVDRLLASLAATQTLNYLREHNATLLDSQTRSFLVQHYFRYGSSADWRRLLAHATENEISHQAVADWLSAEADER